MTVALQPRPPSLFDRPVQLDGPDTGRDVSPPATAGEAVPERRPVVRGGGPTLEALVSGAWEGLAGSRTVVCPVCEATMEPIFGAGALPVAGGCRRCGSRLS